MPVTRDMVETANLSVSKPGMRAAPSYAGWLRRFAFQQPSVKASVLNNAAEVIDQQRIEIARLRAALADASGVPVPAQTTFDPSVPHDPRGRAE